MKAARRHDLQENVLARQLGAAVAFVRTNLNWIIGGLLAVVVVVALTFYAVNQRRVTRDGQWQRYRAWADAVERQGELTGPENPNLPGNLRRDLRLLAEETSQKDLAAWAYVSIGESAHEELRRRQAELDESALELLAGEARQAWQKVVTEHADRPEAVAPAELGLGLLAQTLASLDASGRYPAGLLGQARRELGEPRQHYEAVVALQGRASDLTVARANQQLAALEKGIATITLATSAPSETMVPVRVVPREPATAPTTGPAGTAGEGPAPAPATRAAP